eukprot:3804480-Prymnesium_polylepis.1
MPALGNVGAVCAFLFLVFGIIGMEVRAVPCCAVAGRPGSRGGAGWGRATLLLRVATCCAHARACSPRRPVRARARVDFFSQFFKGALHYRCANLEFAPEGDEGERARRMLATAAGNATAAVAAGLQSTGDKRLAQAVRALRPFARALKGGGGGGGGGGDD